jgi:hypothetical protein
MATITDTIAGTMVESRPSGCRCRPWLLTVHWAVAGGWPSYGYGYYGRPYYPYYGPYEY